MKNYLLILLLTFLLSCTFFAAAEQPEKIGPALVYQAEMDFEDAKLNLLDAIEAEGMVISSTSHAQTMLDRTAESINGKGNIYDKAEIIQFCKVDLSHKLVSANPHNLVLCPYSIAVYSLKTDPKRIYFSYRAPYLDEPVVKDIQKLLDQLILEAIDA
ncbi:MAG: hypothetical protein DSZ28_08410 [Thiothrix sp.]|nr:MAG: hypothetical protein DSZ28_08410 [Thiothrix sp.]